MNSNAVHCNSLNDIHKSSIKSPWCKTPTRIHTSSCQQPFKPRDYSCYKLNFDFPMVQPLLALIWKIEQRISCLTPSLCSATLYYSFPFLPELLGSFSFQLSLIGSLLPSSHWKYWQGQQWALPCQIQSTDVLNIPLCIYLWDPQSSECFPPTQTATFSSCCFSLSS